MTFADLNRAVIAEFRETGGTAGGAFEGAPLLLLHHVGAKSGAARITPLVPVKEGTRIYVFAGGAGSDEHPAWYRNLLARPEVRVETGTETFAALARTVTGPERDRIYAKLAATLPQFDYQHKTDRVIPVVELERVTPG